MKTGFLAKPANFRFVSKHEPFAPHHRNFKGEPFKITCRWTTGEIRVVDFEELMTRWQVDKSAVEAPLRNYETFRFVSVGEGRTLQWVNVPVRHRAFDETGRASETESPLAFDPDVLYAESVSLEEFRLARISTKAAA